MPSINFDAMLNKLTSHLHRASDVIGVGASPIAKQENGALIVAGSGGDARGANAVDLQQTRDVDTQVASGDSAIIAGGYNNMATASFATVSGGSNNAVRNSEATIGGGENNQANGAQSVVGGGIENQANAECSSVIGGKQAITSQYGEVAHAAGCFATPGDAQHSVYLLRGVTTDATPTELFLDGSSLRLTIPTDTTMGMTIDVVACSQYNNSSFSWSSKLLCRNISGDTILDDYTAPAILNSGDVWAGSISVANNELQIIVTGAADTTIHWVAKVDAVIVG